MDSHKSRHLRYRVGIDVGLYSVGLSAIEIDDSSNNPYEALPIQLLSTMSYIHDAGVDPQRAKYADSRKTSSGTARRVHRMRQREHKRLLELDEILTEFGYPVQKAIAITEGFTELNAATQKTYPTWNARIHAVSDYIENETERLLTIAVALRNIARHRGWRNPYSNIASIKEASQQASPFYVEYFKKVAFWLYENDQNNELLKNVTFTTTEKGNLEVNIQQELLQNPNRPTPAQLVAPFLDPQKEIRFRSDYKDDQKSTKLPTQIGKLHQSDYCYEILKIFDAQKVPSQQQQKLLEIIFHQINPRDVGAAAKLVGKDSLPGQEKLPRASRSSLAFQRYRILDTISNLRIKEETNAKRALTVQEIQNVYHFLAEKGDDDTSWNDVADALGIDRNNLIGIGAQTDDGEPISAKHPPILNSNLTIIKAIKKAKNELASFSTWWETASDLEKDIFIEGLDNAGSTLHQNTNDEEVNAAFKVNSFLQSLSEEALQKIEGIDLQSGRAAYSINSLNRLSTRMYEEGVDLHTARKLEFGVDDTWQPSSNPLGTPTGNPAVDRTIQIVSRWLKACEKRWGKPETINIEHVRDGFKTPKTMRKIQAESNKRFLANNAVREEIIEALSEEEGSGTRGIEAVRRSDIRRWQAIQRQNGQCIYCGDTITFTTAQMDHIVPRKGAGSTNELSNLVAACEHCNKDKNNTLFYTWAKTNEKRKEVLERVDTWIQDSYFSSSKQFKNFIKEVKSRLRQKEEDEPIDNRSIESVAWMARELRNQIEEHFGYKGKTLGGTKANESFALKRVNVYRGFLTAEARKASGLENKLPWIGGSQKKTRLDRRHHAVDASVIAMMRPGVGMVLAKRESLRREQLESNIVLEEQLENLGRRFWRNYSGEEGQEQELYLLWRNAQMERLTDLLTDAMNNDRIIVTSSKRLRLKDGRAHADKIRKLVKRHVGDALTPINIDKAATPALWLALTTHPDYDPETGLPEDWNRRIRIHDRWLDAYDTIGFMANGEQEFDVVKNAVCMSVRNGFAEIGGTIHHARFYRIPKINKAGKTTGYKFAYMRVFKIDLIKHQKDDLFSVDIPPQAISRRNATNDLRKALSEGTAEYLGWAVLGDEVEIDPTSKLFSSEGKNAINEFMRSFPEITRFKIVGFNTREQITLEPLYISSEGIPAISDLTEKDKQNIYKGEAVSNEIIEKVNTVMGIGGSFHPSVDKLLSSYPKFIRRNTLGRVRWASNNHMPVSWTVPKN